LGLLELNLSIEFAINVNEVAVIVGLYEVKMRMTLLNIHT
jgi:hypothetical protein